MGDKSGIEWTDATWNPVTGCRKVSPGCAHCYAERVFPRAYAGTGRRFEDVRTHADRLDQPLRWRRPRRVFVNSMSDLFHEDVPDDFIDAVFAAMAQATHHSFQVLTKRPARMRDHCRALTAHKLDRAWRLQTKHPHTPTFPRGEPALPLPNVWLGVSCEDQQRADERIPILLDTPAAVRFVSAEPLLGPINLAWLREKEGNLNALAGVRTDDFLSCGVPEQRTPRLDWVIVGGESGPRARPCDIPWVRSIAQQCRAAGVPCFVKQLGERPLDRAELEGWHDPTNLRRAWRPSDGLTRPDDRVYVRLRDRKGGDPDEWPEDLRVREFPR